MSVGGVRKEGTAAVLDMKRRRAKWAKGQLWIRGRAEIIQYSSVQYSMDMI